MNKKTILKKIIDNNGCCDSFATEDVCAKCPLASLRKKEDGSFMNCVEALNIPNFITSDEHQQMMEDYMLRKAINPVDKIYLKAAKSALFDITLEEALEEKDGTDKQG